MPPRLRPALQIPAKNRKPTSQSRFLAVGIWRRRVVKCSSPNLFSRQNACAHNRWLRDNTFRRAWGRMTSWRKCNTWLADGQDDGGIFTAQFITGTAVSAGSEDMISGSFAPTGPSPLFQRGPRVAFAKAHSARGYFPCPLRGRVAAMLRLCPFHSQHAEAMVPFVKGSCVNYGGAATRRGRRRQRGAGWLW